MSPDLLLRNAIVPALALLPPKMDNRAARAMLLAIALQESRIAYRGQLLGPARGYWQFEQGGGVRGVLQHEATRTLARTALAGLDYLERCGEWDCYIAIEHNDILAGVFARLLLWTLPQTLPARGDPREGWRQYTEAWRPGKPHRETWDDFYAQAWQLTDDAARGIWDRKK